jgi:hypothetical protein
MERNRRSATGDTNPLAVLALMPPIGKTALPCPGLVEAILDARKRVAQRAFVQ